MFLWHEEAWKQLVDQLDRQPHALLFHGPRGVGKLALAERYVQLLLCEARGAAPCGACDGCRWVLAGQHPDFRRLEPETLARQQPEEETVSSSKAKPSAEIKIDQVRALEGFVHIGSHRGARRVVLVHPAEDMNTAAANSLLKNLEEPPGGACFVLVSHRPARLLPTIRSRCVALPVRLPPAAQALAWLAQQGVPQPERWLAVAGGAPLRALEYANGG